MRLFVQAGAAEEPEVALALLNPLLSFGRLALALRKVTLNLIRVSQKVIDHGIDVGQRECRVPLNNRLRSRSVLKRTNDHLQQYARLSDAQRFGRILA